MTRLRYNNETGTLGAALTNSGTTITFSTPLPDFATITGSDYIVLALDAGTPSYEIVYLTAYTASTTTGTITRQAEDSAHWPAVAHNATTGTWACVPTTTDYTPAAIGADVAGAANAANATTIQTVPVSATAPTSGQLFEYSGTAWTPTTPVVSTPVVGTGTFGSTVTPSAGYNIFLLTLTGSCTMAAPSGSPFAGQQLQINLTQDSVGSRIVTWGSGYTFSASLPAPTLSTTASATDVLIFEYSAVTSSWWFVQSIRGFGASGILVPGPPTGVAATAGNASATVIWTAPTSNGGAAITNYIVTPSPGSPVTVGNVTSTVISGLTNGTNYTFTVQAINSQGTGPASTASPSVEPEAPPVAAVAYVGNDYTSTQTAALWAGWKQRNLNGPGANSGAVVRQTSNDWGGNDTTGNGYNDVVSEGQAFGLMLAVQFNDQITFNTVYNWTAANLQRVNLSSSTPGWDNGVALNCFAWHYDWVTQAVVDADPAPDADIDVVTALLWADARWGSLGSLNYKQLALNIAHDVKQYFFLVDSTTGYAYGPSTTEYEIGKVTGEQFDCSYGDPTAFRLLAIADTANSQFWVNAINGWYHALNADITYTVSGEGAPVGLPSDQYQISAGAYNSTTDTYAGPFSISSENEPGFGYDAVKVPIRTCWDWEFHAEARALAFLGGTGKGFLASKYISSVGIPAAFSHDGTTNGGYELSLFHLSYFQFLTTNDQGNTTGASLYTNFLSAAELYVVDATKGGAYISDLPGYLHSGYYGDFWALVGVLMISGEWTDYGALAPSAGLPGAPTGVTAAATSGSTTVTVTWVAPSSNGGSAITGYLITPSIGSPVTVGNVLTFPVTGLTFGDTYTFTVSAININGTGTPSTVSNSVTPEPALPGAPTIGTATAGAASATVTWTAPGSNGGAPITAYVVTPFIGATAQTTQTFGAVTSGTLIGLTNGTAYTFKVAATTTAGTGPQSAASNSATPTAATVPAAPTIGTAAPANASAIVNWTSNSQGGSAITGFSIKPFIGATAQTPIVIGGNISVITYTVTGLTNGTAYTFEVAAINSVGTGSYSAASNAVTPSGSGAFVSRSGSELIQAGSQFRYAGANIYWMGVDDNIGDAYPTNAAVLNALSAAVSMNLKVIRSTSMGVSLGSAYSLFPNYTDLNTSSPNTAAWAPIDYAIEQCAIKGLKLWIPLIDQWRYYTGGKWDLVHWAATNGVTGVIDTYSNMALNAGNTVWGVIYVNNCTFATSGTTVTTSVPNGFAALATQVAALGAGVVQVAGTGISAATTVTSVGAGNTTLVLNQVPGTTEGGAGVTLTFVGDEKAAEQQFYYNSTIIGYYENYINQILTHVNQYTGIAYNADPTIMVWETGNELFDAPTAWTEQIATYIKSVAPNQLVADGSAAGGNPIGNAALTGANVDIVGDHFYTYPVGLNSSTPVTAAQDANYAGLTQGDVVDDANIAATNSKVYVVGEYGWALSSSTTAYVPALPPFLETLQNTANVSGSMLWSILPIVSGTPEGHDGQPPNNYGVLGSGNDDDPLYYPALTGETPANTMTNAVAAISAHGLAMSGTTVAPTAFLNASPGGGVNGHAYSYTFVANGYPVPTYTVATGTIPAGLTLSTAGVLSGTPTTNTTYTFTVKATNTGGNFTSGSLSVVIQTQPPNLIQSTTVASTTAAATSYTVGGATATLVLSNAQPSLATSSLLTTFTGVGFPYIYPNPTTTVAAPVTAASTYAGWIAVVLGTANASIQGGSCEISWYNSAGTYLSSSAEGTYTVCSPSGVTVVTVTAVAPAGAAFAIPAFISGQTATVGDKVYLSQFGIFATAVPPYWVS